MNKTIKQYLNSLPDVLKTAPDGDKQLIKPGHLLYQYGVHTLFIRGGVFT